MRRQSLQTWLLAAAAACLAVFLLRVLNVVPSAAPWLWDKAYNATEIFVIVVCALRARAARGTERAAWAVLTSACSATPRATSTTWSRSKAWTRRRIPPGPTRAT